MCKAGSCSTDHYKVNEQKIYGKLEVKICGKDKLKDETPLPPRVAKEKEATTPNSGSISHEHG